MNLILFGATGRVGKEYCASACAILTSKGLRSR